MADNALRTYFNNLEIKDKKKFEKFTYHSTTEPIHQKRIRGFDIFVEDFKVKSIKDIEEFLNG